MAKATPTTFESKVLRNQMDIDAAASGVANEMIRALDKARNEITSKLQNLSPDSIYTRAQLQSKLQEIDATLLKVKSKWRDNLVSAREDVITHEYESLTTLLNSEIAANTGAALITVPTKIPTMRLRALMEKTIQGKRLDDWLGDSFQRLKTEIGREMSTAQILGEGGRKAATRLRKSLELHRHSADIIARTTLIQAGTDARNEVYDANASYFPSYTYRATLDSRTCLICGPDDGLIKKEREKLPQPTRHPRCRCAIVANTIFDDEPMEREVVREEERKTVHHRDGTTSTKIRKTKVEMGTDKLSYEDFFNSQPEAWQRQVLGNSRFELYKAGKLNLDDLRGGASRVLSVDELKLNYKDRFEEVEGKLTTKPGVTKNKPHTAKVRKPKPLEIPDEKQIERQQIELETKKKLDEFEQKAAQSKMAEEVKPPDPKKLEARRKELETKLQTDVFDLSKDELKEWGDAYNIRWSANTAGKTEEMMSTIRSSAKQAAKSPEHYRQILKQNGSRLELIPGAGVSEHPEFTHLKGVRPRGHPEWSTWDRTPGLYNWNKKIAVCNTDKLYVGHGSANLVLHEVGHAIDDAFGKIIGRTGISGEMGEKRFLHIWNINKRKGLLTNPYFIDYVEEYFAESYAMYYDGPETRAKLPANLRAYFKKLEKEMKRHVKKD